MGSCLSSNPPVDIEQVKKFVDGEIADNKVMVFSKSYCPHCKKAKSALNSIGSNGASASKRQHHLMQGLNTRWWSWMVARTVLLYRIISTRLPVLERWVFSL